MRKADNPLGKAGGWRPAGTSLAGRARHGRRQRLGGRVASGLLPLLKLLDVWQLQPAAESVFHARRQQFQQHLALACAELHAVRPRHQALALSVRVLAGVLREEIQAIGPEEVRRARKELLLATLKNAPALLSVVRQARLLS